MSCCHVFSKIYKTTIIKSLDIIVTEKKNLLHIGVLECSYALFRNCVHNVKHRNTFNQNQTSRELSSFCPQQTEHVISAIILADSENKIFEAVLGNRAEAHCG